MLKRLVGYVSGLTLVIACGQTGQENFYSDAGSAISNAGSKPGASAPAQPGISVSDVPVTSGHMGQGSVFDADEIDGLENRKRQCAEYLGIALGKIRVYSPSVGAIQLKADEAMLLSVEAARKGYALRINSGSAQVMGGLCIIMRGSSNVAKVDIESEIKGVYIVALGDQSNVKINTKKPLGKISGNSYAWVGGNQALVEFVGDGAYACPSVRYTGNKAQVKCR